MQIGEFNANFSRAMASVVANGEPEPITRHNRDWVTLVPTGLFDELIQSAGADGQDILARYRAQAEQREEARQRDLTKPA